LRLDPEFAAQLLGDKRLTIISHYSLRAGRHFNSFIDKAGRENFEAFCKNLRPEYERFVNEERGLPLVPKDFNGVFRVYSGDMERLFKWQVEMGKPQD
jgi:hypothetical protein